MEYQADYLSRFQQVAPPTGRHWCEYILELLKRKIVDMETTEETLQTKLVQLRLNIERTQAILSAGKQEVIEGHLAALKATIAEVDESKRSLEAKKDYYERRDERHPETGRRN